MDLKAAAEAVVSVATPLMALIGVGGRQRRRRSEIRENLALIEELRKDPLIAEQTLTIAWLQGRITVDVAKVAGQPLGARKKPIPWGSLIFALLLSIAFGGWAYLLSREHFVWYSVFPGTLSLLLAISVIGMVTSRELPTDPDLPSGATPVRSATAEERVASAVQLAAAGGNPEMFAPAGQVGVALHFFSLMRQGAYEMALEMAEENWLTCRIQSRLWSRHVSGEIDDSEMRKIAHDLSVRREPRELWREFVEAEAAQFMEAWASIDPASLGAAGRRRRMSRDSDLVILVPLASTEGYFVSSATVVPNSLPFLMRKVAGRWVVANHAGYAPPTPGWPPVWWVANDPVIESLPES